MTKMGLLSCLFVIAQSACASDLMIQRVFAKDYFNEEISEEEL